MHKKQRLSALMDGELAGLDTEQAMAELSEPAGQATWRSYRAIGETLRADQPELSEGFAASLAARLDAEPAPGARAPRRRSPAKPRPAPDAAEAEQEGAPPATILATP
ncbi:sigma-E factor negative regulatory protein [Pseudoduganella namucuonensis]|uniref:Anti sigma-E protein RseA, N-terminal domain n=1 Tax=Pseudoduganella namucuonensis TaxID=1035707 RepID=A0A1I7LG52_9BURK|nr:RseA family anti-sigma factor [Pseudoduganella namucuonensis]SFV08661.1 Anti sigma-E protein RseA, N-terminal domain [Pseudoduganella namucuonensis]